MKKKQWRFIVAVMSLGFALLSVSVWGDATAEYPNSAPTVEANRVLSFTWDDVDKYPLTTTLAFLPMKKEVITGGDDCRLCVWNLENGALLNHFKADEDWIRSVAVSPDGETLASLSHDGSIKLWSTADWKVKSTFSKVANGAEGIAYSPDGQTLAVCGFESRVTLFDAATGKVKSERPMPGTGNTIIRFSPDGKLLAAAGRHGTVRVWDAASMKVVYDLKTDGRRVHDIAFSMDGSLLAAGGESSSIFVWMTGSGQRKQTISTEVGKTFSLCFCGNDIIASGDSLNSVRLWNLGGGEEIGRCLGHTGTIAAMFFDLENGELLTGGFDTTVRTWPLAAR